MANLQEAKTLAIELMNQHGLHDWKFEWMHSKRILGQCHSTRKLIRISAITSKVRTIDRVKNTILHEIAHALVGGWHGHDGIWQRKAMEIGCDGERVANEVVDVQAKYIAKCDCGVTHKAHRRPKRDHWCKCKGRAFNQLEKLTYTQQY